MSNVAEFPLPDSGAFDSRGSSYDERTGSDGPGRVPPNDVTAEMCVLGAMLLSKDAIADVVEALKIDDFYRPQHATVGLSVQEARQLLVELQEAIAQAEGAR